MWDQIFAYSVKNSYFFPHAGAKLKLFCDTVGDNNKTDVIIVKRRDR